MDFIAREMERLHYPAAQLVVERRAEDGSGRLASRGELLEINIDIHLMISRFMGWANANRCAPYTLRLPLRRFQGWPIAHRAEPVSTAFALVNTYLLWVGSHGKVVVFERVRRIAGSSPIYRRSGYPVASFTRDEAARGIAEIVASSGLAWP